MRLFIIQWCGALSQNKQRCVKFVNLIFINEKPDEDDHDDGHEDR